jgi:hypothetical protein
VRDLRTLVQVGVLEAFATNITPSPDDIAKSVKAAIAPARTAILYDLSGLETRFDALRHKHAGTISALDRHFERQQQEAAEEAATGHSAAAMIAQLPVRGFFVYVLWAAGEPVYVGSSRNVLCRLGSHLGSEKRHIVDRVTVKEYPAERAMLEAELALIQFYSPPLNIIGVMAG